MICRCDRRHLLISGTVALLIGPQAQARGISPRFIAEAFRMRDIAISAGDQPYGAVVALGDAIIGYGPSQMVLDRDPDRHAERVAITDAQARSGRSLLAGAVLVSTSRACSDCQNAAAKAAISGMFYGKDGADAGTPRLRSSANP